MGKSAVVGERQCTKCQRILPETSKFFYRDRGAWAARCKPCFIAKQKDWALSKRVAGIYVIQHCSSGQVYVGSAGCLRQRWSQHRHLLRSGRHHSPRLQRAWTRDGEKAFAFKVLELVDREDLLITIEQAWIEFLGAYNKRGGYNALPQAGRVTGYQHTEETKALLLKQNVAKAQAYIVTFPDGREEEVQHLGQFCRERELHTSTMFQVGKGSKRTYKGYSCRLATMSREAWESNVALEEARVVAKRDPNNRRFPTQRRVLIHPDGTRQEFVNILKTAKSLGVPPRTFHAFVTGEYKTPVLFAGYAVQDIH
ncbi:GIY-YIG nuclease family protein [Deinococcus sp. QL22]|uniref:GIY-YIG nuclease family protein n=1 Tax=Deinococcus sp. QL22 TaxID=2939437 RepID=UPI002017A12A|nr:GIY-YIG nuclease family protein [Deinococcus sp. QL22]UQN10359.1 GIY-YIG nuclease family protein [Deinococcus sp. QL22]UQN10493.1 GIY-YIG nuclease family protein [Deinococcus sp. QL22]